MAIKVGNSWVSETAYAYAQNKIQKNPKMSTDILEQVSKGHEDMNFTTSKVAYKKGLNNISIDSTILQQMRFNPEKRLEYEALIYDCSKMQSSLEEQFALKGKKLVSHGFIISADGTLSSWSVSKKGGKKLRSACILSKTNNKSWISSVLNSAYTSNDSSYLESLLKSEGINLKV